MARPGRIIGLSHSPVKSEKPSETRPAAPETAQGGAGARVPRASGKHGPSMIKKDEEIISALEQLDSTFSQINRVLKQIKRKVDVVEESNRALIKDCDPWCRFFGLEKPETADTLETPLQLATDTQSFLKHSSPVNPFCRERSGQASAAAAGNGGAVDAFADGSTQASDTMVSDLVDFDQALLPEGFQEISEIKMIYYFIEKRRTVPVEEVYERFSCVSRELMEILLDVLIRKNFVRLEENRLSV
ncbi:UNVERIFIED_CONTAM: hypothetical protein PYX00_011302 [Menopon gallinae]|uniref:Outer kinetochore protein ASK1 n=1 Tax=Menopon gallinae TaxID=328185 RepID=A0AAW2H724_9NEOP